MDKLCPTIADPISKQLKAERVGDYYLTTASWQPCGEEYVGSYETGIRYNGAFRLVQHGSYISWEKAHEWVKKQILDGVPYQDLKEYERGQG